MKQQGLAYFTDTYLTLIAMVIFMLVFVGMVAWTYRRQAKEMYKKMAEMPLQEDQGHE